MADAPSPDVVRVQLLFHKKAEERPQPNVKKCTSKGNEVVDVNGFTFIRKRKLPADDDAPMDQQSDPHAHQQRVEPADARLHLHGAMHEGRDERMEDTGAGAPCDDVSAQSCMDGPAAANAHVQGHLTLAADGVCHARAPVSLRPLAEEVAELVQYVPQACPKHVQAQWLVERALQLAAQRAGGKQAAADAVALASSFTSALDQQVAAANTLLQGGQAELQQFEGLAPMLKDACASSKLLAQRRQQLLALQQEESAWLQLQSKYQPGAGGAGGTAGAAPVASTPLPLPADPDTVPWLVDAAPLADAQARTQLQLSLQVEAVINMVDKAERLVQRTEHACAVLQAQYHKENFQTYVHVNSPQVLVKLLSQSAAIAPPPLGSQQQPYMHS